MQKKFILIFIGFCMYCQNSKAQGCSDAGFCTIGGLAHQEMPDSTQTRNFKNSAKLSFSYGLGEQNTSIYQIITDAEIKFIKNYSVQFKIPYVYANGNLGSNNGMGDLVVSFNGKYRLKNKAVLNATIGGKFPTGKTDDGSASLSLPMPYQTGLGTYDLILGASLQFQQWNFGAGYQRVLKNQNKNNFLYGETLLPVKNAYFESNLLDRGDDALLRIERNFKIRKVNLSVGLLGIYRLQKDKITWIDGKQGELDGSRGLTLNITGTAQYEFSGRTGMALMFGAPVLVREVRPDGLTRELVTTLSFQFHF